MKPSKRQIAKVEKQLKEARILKVGGSESQKSVAEFLVKHYPKDANKIATGMEQAATAKGMKRRFARLRAVVASASASAAA